MLGKELQGHLFLLLVQKKMHENFKVIDLVQFKPSPIHALNLDAPSLTPIKQNLNDFIISKPYVFPIHGNLKVCIFSVAVFYNV